MLGFTEYSQICNNYCICYFGYSTEYLVQLRLLRPCLERVFPGLNIYLGCKDEVVEFFADQSKILKLSQIKLRKPEFAHIRELRFDGFQHPIEKLLEEAGITNVAISIGSPVVTTRCVILTTGSYPTVNLTQSQINRLKKIAREEGFEPVVDESVSQSGWVMGVENARWFEAASKGVRMTLVPTGLGTNLVKKMFPQTQILMVN